MTDAALGDLVVLDRASGAVQARVRVGTGSAMVAVSRDGRRVYVTRQSGSILTVLDAGSRRIIARVPVGSGPHGLRVTPDGRLLYVAINNAHAVAVVNTATDRVVASVALPGPADELALWP
jgi:YVTN family beta-propeller protein